MAIYEKTSKTNVDFDIRFFRRYPREIPFTILIKDRLFEAKTVDYSLIGVGIIINDSAAPLNKGDLIDLDIKELDIHEEAKTAWVAKTPSGLRVGVHRTEPLKGRFSIYLVADVLIGLQRTLRTGILEVRYRSLEENIFLKDGDIVFAESNYEKDRLADVLLKSRKINRRQYDKAEEMRRRSGSPYAAILIHMGYIKPQDLKYAADLQAKRTIKRLFMMKDAEFEFIEGPFLLDDATTLKVSVSDLIYRETKKNADVKLLESYLLDSVVDLSSNPLDLFQRIHFTTFDRAVISYVDGERSIRDIIRLSGSLSRIDPLKVIYALLEARFLKTRGRHEPPTRMDGKGIFEREKVEAPTYAAGHLVDREKSGSAHDIAQQRFRDGKTAFWDRQFDEAARLFATAIYFDPSVAAYHYYYGSTLLSLGKPKKAIEALNRADELKPLDAATLAEFGHAYLSLEFPLRAKACFDKALKLVPSNKRAIEGIRMLEKKKPK